MYLNSVILPAIFALCSVPAFANDRVPLINDLDACVTDVQAESIEYNNLLLLRVQLDSKKNIGHCGCKSAVASYTVSRDGKIIRNQPFVLMQSREVDFILSGDTQLLEDRSELSVTISCST